MTPAQLQLLLAMARLLKNMAVNPVASIGTKEIAEALCRVETETRRGAAPEIDPAGHEWAKIAAGFAFVDTMTPRADDPTRLMWCGWALRAAFIAGAEWQERRTPSPQ